AEAKPCTRRASPRPCSIRPEHHGEHGLSYTHGEHWEIVVTPRGTLNDPSYTHGEHGKILLLRCHAYPRRTANSGTHTSPPGGAGGRVFGPAFALALVRMSAARGMNGLIHGETTAKILGAARTVHSRLGPGLLERPYRVCLGIEMKAVGLSFEAEKT